MINLERKVLICECCSLDHQVSFAKFEDEPNTIYVETHLTTHRGFLRRLWYGLKYAFGYKSRYGAWDEIILEEKSLADLRNFLKTKDKKKQ